MKKLKLAFLSAISMLTLATTALANDVEIKSKKGSYAGNRVNVELELWNRTSSAMDLGDMTVRYYFQSNPGSQYVGDVWYYDGGGYDPQIRCTAQASYDGANQFCDIIFAGNSSKVAAGHAVSLEVAFNNQPLITENFSDDYSKPANYLNFTTNDKIVVYKDGNLIWGKEAGRDTSMLTGATYDSRDSNGYIEPVIGIRNLTSTGIATSALKIRYYFTAGRYAMTPEVWYENFPGSTAVSCGLLDVAIVNRTRGANAYCEVTFPDGKLMNPYAYNTVNFAAWNNQGVQDQSDDWSWNGTTNAINKRLAVFYGNSLVWGDIPR